ncbi:MAG: NADH dehydrogenase subunit [Bacteroidetes bacterium]|nr:NADH dehydrogenase subunit [Bacteroidota bacterium]
MTAVSAVIRNQGVIPLTRIPVVSYPEFIRVVDELMTGGLHCVNYFAWAEGDMLKFIICLANDSDGTIHLLMHKSPKRTGLQLDALSLQHYQLHIFEREISENFGVDFTGHPWPKPVRYAWNRADQSKLINNYPFYKIDSDELHEVGVGPIHAGVIEPGHFRFLCNGETVLHLEIQLGWQHRGVESLFLTKPGLLQRTILAESIASDTSVGHSLAFVSLLESLAGINPGETLEMERTLALELERIAMHLGDLSNVNIGMAYQLASAVFGTLRTPVINYTQTWCGNRFGKGLNRVGGSHYPFNDELAAKLLDLMNKVEETAKPMADRLFGLPSFLMRSESIGRVTEAQTRLIGAVGMAARNAGVARDIRVTHPFASYRNHPIESQTLTQGDVWARMMLRNLELNDSVYYVRDLTRTWMDTHEPVSVPAEEKKLQLAADSFAVSLVEGWRGEVCHCAVTGSNGAIVHYKVKDPSLHNWMALALSLRNLEISDFPINNKSYNLSYCGFDL